MKPTVSVVIPAYNAENKIRNCVQSLLRQTFMPCEILIIDDGSTDGTAQVLDEIQTHESRITIIHQENRGVSRTRNRGIDEAQGLYIMFVDADDDLEEHALEVLVREVEPLIVPVIGYCECYEDGTEKSYCFDTIRPQTTADMHVFAEAYCDVAIHFVWNKLFERELLLKHNIRFPEDISLGEDLLFNLQYLRCQEGIRLIHQPLYHYSIQNNGENLNGRSYPNLVEIKERLLSAVLWFCKDNRDRLSNLNLVMDRNLKELMNAYIWEYQNSQASFLKRWKQGRERMNSKVLRSTLYMGAEEGGIGTLRKVLISRRMFLLYYIATRINHLTKEKKNVA